MKQKNGKKLTIGIIVFSLLTAATVVHSNKLDPETKVIKGFLLKNGVVDKQFTTKTTDLSRQLDSTMLYVEQKQGDDTVSLLVPLSYPVDSTVLSKDTIVGVTYTQ